MNANHHISHCPPYCSFDQLFHKLTYPAGESHVALRPDADLPRQITIEACVRDFNHLGMVLTADQILRRNGTTARWFLPYFPFARHDRRNHAGDGFELGVALELVRNLNVVIADPHSDVAGQLPHFTQTDVVARLSELDVFDGDTVVVIPDAGATKKAFDWLPSVRHRTVVQALKRRDTASGRLFDFQLLTDHLEGAPCVIVDDLCDGGGTFLALADLLSAHHAGPLTLAVTHGLFTKGTHELSRRFDRIVSFAYLPDTDAAGPTPSGVELVPFKDLYSKGAQQ